MKPISAVTAAGLVLGLGVNPGAGAWAREAVSSGPARTVKAAGVEHRLPRLVEQPSAEERLAAMPRPARLAGMAGWAELRCTVTVEGRLEACAPRRESAPGAGFSAAALRLAPLRRYEPATRAGTPEAMSIPVWVSFDCRAGCGPAIAQLTPDSWMAAPTPAQVFTAYPAAAKSRGLAGAARLRCLTTPAGALKDCEVVDESSEGEGFGAAAVGLAPLFRVPPLSNGQTRGPVPVTVAFDPEGDGRATKVFAKSPDPLPRPVGALPGGKARVTCVVGPEGGLERCAAAGAAPDLARAVVDNLGAFRAMLWTADGRSTMGSSITLESPAFGWPTVIPPDNDPPAAPGAVDYRPAIPLTRGAVAEHYPAKALKAEISGHTTIRCDKVVQARLQDCSVQSETPAEQGFGAAGLEVAADYRIQPETIDGVAAEGPFMLPLDFRVE